MAKKVILRKETIPDAEKVLGQVAVQYNTGGNYQASFSSSDVNNFNVVNEGQIEIRDPERSYLTSTLYPLSFMDAFRSHAKNNLTGYMTDNLYASSGVSESSIVGVKSLQVPLFKKVLVELAYSKDSLSNESFKTRPKEAFITLRNVLITKDASIEKFTSNAKALTVYFRTVLIEYKDWSVDKLSFKGVSVSIDANAQFTSKFKTLLIGDSENVNTVISDKVVTLKDAGVLTWKVPTTLTVDRVTPKMGAQTLLIDEDYEYVASNQSIGISSESGVELFFEDWFKPELATKALLTTYNYVDSFSEVSALTDKTNAFTWTSNKSFSTSDYVLDNSQYIDCVNRDFTIASPVSGQKGTTIEMTCKVTGTDRIYLLANGSQSFNNAVGESLALVWFGANSATNKNKFAIITDKTSLVSSDNILIVSTDEYLSGSEVHIAIVAYDGYYRLFINGKLQGVKAVSVPLTFSYGSRTLIGKSLWYNYVAEHTLTVKAFRFTSLALYTTTFNTPDPYRLTVIPNIPKVSDSVAGYKTGITCGLRYDQSENNTYAFAAVTDTYGETFTVRSTALDCSKWNFIQLANTGSELTLFINGIANTSKRLPYNIKFKDVLIGGKDSNNFKGAIDNFRIYSKLKDSGLPLRSSELFMKICGADNTKLLDSNGILTWKSVSGVAFTANALAVRGSELDVSTKGIYTDNASRILNKDFFELQLGLRFVTYSSSSPVNTTIPQASTTAVTYTQDNSLSFNFNATGVGSILTTSTLNLEAVSYSSSAYKLKLNIAGESIVLSTPFKFNKAYNSLIFKFAGFVYLYIDDVQYLALELKSSLDFSSVITSNTAQITAFSTYNYQDSTKILVDNSDGSKGLVMKVLEVFKSKFLITVEYSSALRSVATLLVSTGYTDTVLKQNSSELNLIFNGVEAGIFDNVYSEGTDRLVILNNYNLSSNCPLGLSYFSSISSQQDGILGIPYKLTNIFNETIYNDTILNLSSDSLYGNPIVDRSANSKSKEVLNITENGSKVTKALKEPGFYFDGKSNLQLDSDDFAFGVEPFYIEFEVKLKTLNARATILDRYASSAGSWQISINTDGHLYFTITNSNSAPYYYFIDVPTSISTDKWYKIQVNRSGAVYKFYLNDEMVYEYSTGVVFDFNRKSIPLSIGRQMYVRNSNYDFKGYLNNIRIVKGSSMDSDFSDVGTITTVPFNDYDCYIDDDFNSELLTYGVATAKGTGSVFFTNNGLALASASGYGYKDTNSLVSTQGEYMVASTKLGAGSFNLSFDCMFPTKSSSGYAIPVLQVGTVAEGEDGFALSIFSDYAGNSSIYLRNSYSSLVRLTCSPSNWHKISVSREGSELYLTVDGLKSEPLTTSLDFSTVKQLAIGKSVGQWLEARTVYFDNIRLATGSSTLDAYASLDGSLSSATTAIAENYTMYNSNSSTLLHVHASSGIVKDTKNIELSQDNVNVVDILSNNFQKSMRFEGTSRLYTTASTVDTCFTTSSNFTLEANLAVTSLGSNQTILRSYNQSSKNTHWILKLSDDLTGITFSVNTGSSFKDFTANFKMELSTWYKIAVTVADGSVILHVNDDIYRFSDKITAWQDKGTLGSATYIGENLRGFIEVVRITGKALYTKGKGIRNLNRDSHLQLGRGSVIDDGNQPSTWSTTGAFGVSKFKDNIQSLIFSNTSNFLETVQAINPDRSAFTITANISFDNTALNFNVMNLTFDNNTSLALTKNGNALQFKVVNEGVELSTISIPSTYLLASYNVIRISRDFSNNLELQVNSYTTTSTNFSSVLSKGTLNFSGFLGQIHEVEVFNLDSVSSQSTYNIFKLSFEKGAVTEKYVVANNEGLIFENNVGVEVKGLSKTSDSVLAFDGFESYLYTPENYKIRLKDESFELTFSMYPTNGTNQYQTILSNGSVSTEASSCFVMMIGSQGANHITNGANKLILGTFVSMESNPFLTSTTQIPYNTWTDVRIVRDGSNWSLFLNGVLDSTATFSGYFDIGYKGVYIGKNCWDGVPTSSFTGYLEDVALSQRGVYESSVDVALNEGLISGLDFEDVGVTYDVIKSPYKPDYVDSYTNTWSYGRYGTSAEYPYHETVSAVNEALYFPGLSYMYMFNKHFAPGLDPFSLSVDFMQTQRSNSYIFCIDTMYHLRISSNNLYFRFNGLDYNMGVVSLNTWYTFAISRDSVNTIRIFMNGKVIFTLLNNRTNVDQGTSLYPMVLGRRWDYRESSSYTYENFIGYIDNFYFERGYAKYTADYSVYTDKTLKNSYDSLLSFSASGGSDKNTALTWTSSEITFVTGMSDYRAIAGRNTSTTGFMKSGSIATGLGYKDFTLELYIRPSQIVSEACLLDLSVDAVTQRGLKIIQPASSASSLTVQIGSSTASEWDLALNTGINTIANNKTYHLRLTRNLGTIYLYLDGSLKAKADYTSYISINNMITLFNNISKNKGFNGVIEQFRFKNGQSFSAEATFPKLTGEFR